MLSLGHWIGLICAACAVFAALGTSARTRRTVDGFSVGGRSASPRLVAGALVGTMLGGSATIGTAQAAVTVGFSAWWFTCGATLGFLLLAWCYAVPLRRSGMRTVAEYMTCHYGRAAGIATSAVSVLGIFFSLVASGLAGIHFMQMMLPVSRGGATVLLLAAVVLYVLAGGIKGTAVSGLVKTVLLYATVGWAGLMACTLMEVPPLGEMLRAVSPATAESFGGRALSVVIGAVVTQSYAQAVYSARDTASAVRGALIAAALCAPIGLPLIAIGIAVGQTMPDLAPVQALPYFLLTALPPVVGGLGLGALLLAIIGSIAGLSLGAATSFTVDIVRGTIGLQNDRTVLTVLRLSLVAITAAAFALSLYYYHSQLLYWNFLSFSLRGAGLFFPFLAAILYGRRYAHTHITANIIVSTLLAITAALTDTAVLSPLCLGMTASLLWLALEIMYHRIR